MVFSDLRISNAVVTGLTSAEFDLNMTYENLVITDDITKIQFNNKQRNKHTESPCKTFYNQITISLANKINIKLFNNGNFQISGIKSVKTAKDNLQSILSRLLDIKGEVEIEPTIYNGVMCYNNKILVHKGNYYQTSGSVKNGNFVINGESCIKSFFNDNLFINVRHVNKRKNLYNLNCELVGYAEFQMNRKSKNLCLKDCHFVKESETVYKIYNRYTYHTGFLNIIIHGEIIESPKELLDQSKVVLRYRACSTDTIPEILSVNVANINCNAKYLMPEGCVLNRELICSHLLDKSVQYNYDPCKYPGVKITYNQTKITIFRTGSVLFSGKQETKGTFLWLKQFFDENDFVKNLNEPVIDNDNEEISIWDIL